MTTGLIGKEQEKAMDGSGTNLMESLLGIAPHTEVVHHIPGRIRLRIMPSGLKAVRGMNFDSIIGALPGIESVRINAIVGSTVVKYDSGKLPYSFWEEMRQLRTKPQLAEQLREHLRNLVLESCNGTNIASGRTS